MAHEWDGEAAKPTFRVTLLGHLQRSIDPVCGEIHPAVLDGVGLWGTVCHAHEDKASRGLIPSLGQGKGWEMAEGWHRLEQNGSQDAGPIFLFLSDNREEGKGKQNCIWRPSCELIISRRNNQVIISAGLQLKPVFF